jgi:ubiquinone/menaquinone biosynthesis C-methylase UbiE
MTRTETIMLDHENRIRDEFTRQAETFSSSAAITDAALTQRFIDALGEAARGSVLDVACGPGILSAAIAKAARQVVACDLTPQMLRKAAQRCADSGLDNVTFREGNATELPFADAAFDAVVTRLSVHHFDRPRPGDVRGVPRSPPRRQFCRR